VDDQTPADRLRTNEITYEQYRKQVRAPVEKLLRRADEVARRLEKASQDSGAESTSR